MKKKISQQGKPVFDVQLNIHLSAEMKKELQVSAGALEVDLSTLVRLWLKERLIKNKESK